MATIHLPFRVTFKNLAKILFNLYSIPIFFQSVLSVRALHVLLYIAVISNSCWLLVSHKWSRHSWAEGKATAATRVGIRLFAELPEFYTSKKKLLVQVKRINYSNN